MPTILVADDNSNIQKMVELALKDLGYRVEKVGNGEYAVRRLPEITPDLILADIFMPVRNGYEVCEYVKGHEEYAHIPVVLLQGKFDPLDQHEMKRVRADGVLAKPFVPPDQLITTVKTLLEKAELQKVKAAPAASPEATIKMSPGEVAALTGEAPEAPPEPEIEEYATAPPHIEIREGEQPLAFQDLLQTSPAEAQPEAVQAEEVAVPEPAPPLEPASKQVPEPVEEPAAVEAMPAPGKTPEWGEIKEELKQPSPDEPPIHVEFGEAQPTELVTEEAEVSPRLAGEAAPLPELVTAASEWIQSAPPAVTPPVEEPEAAEPAAAEPKPYQAPTLEELAAPVGPADALPAAAAPAPAEAVPARAPELQAFTPPQPLDPAVVDAVVEKILARLHPQMMEQISREILRPLVEALLRKEPEK